MAYNRTIMNREYHVQIMQQALEKDFSATALAKIIEANLNQDRLSGLVGHDEFHFDSNAFEKSNAYIEAQRALVISSLQSKNAASAWAAFGRLTHSAQDFYAHSNYIDLWRSRQPDGAVPIPSDVDPIHPDLIDSRALRSGKIYLPLEAFTVVDFLKPLVLPLLPRDSHAWMNLDSPAQGPNFPFAIHAAVKRTRIEFEKTITGLARNQVDLFMNK